MTATKSKILSYALSFIMAFTIFGVLGTSPVNAEEDVAFTITLSTTEDGTTFKDTKVLKEFTYQDLERLANVDNGKYMWANEKDGITTVNVFRVTKGIKLTTLIDEAADGYDLASYCGIQFWDNADRSAYYKLGDFRDYMASKTYFYGDATFSEGTVKWGDSENEVEPVLALEYGQTTLNNNGGTPANNIEDAKYESQTGNRIFLGMKSRDERGGKPSMTNCPGIDLEQKVTDLSKATVKADDQTYDGKAKMPAVTVTLDDKSLTSGTDYEVGYKDNVNAGKATVTVTGTGAYFGTATATFTIAKAKNPVTVKAKKPSVKFKKLKKKNQKIAVKKAFTVSKAQGKVTYKKVKGNKKITVAKNGKITVKKKLKKGTYTVKVKVTAAGNKNYNSGSKTVSLKVKVK